MLPPKLANHTSNRLRISDWPSPLAFITLNPNPAACGQGNVLLRRSSLLGPPCPANGRHIRVQGCGTGSVPGPGRQSTRWATTVSSRVNLHHTINFGALCGADLVTRWSRSPQNRGERKPRTPPWGPSPLGPQLKKKQADYESRLTT